MEVSPEQPREEVPRLPLHDRIFWFTVGLGLLVGLTINLLPVTFKIFQIVFEAGYERQGRTEALFFLGALIGGLMAGSVTSRLGISRSAQAGLLFGGLGCLLVGSAQGFGMVQLGAVLMGLGNVWLTVIWGTVVAERFQDIRQRVFAALTLTMAISGTLAPMALGTWVSEAWLKRSWPWWLPYLALALLFFLCLRFVPRPQLFAQGLHKSSALISCRSLLAKPARWLIGFGTILHGMGQMGAVVWLARLYENRLELPESQVGIMISSNLLGFITGRIIWTRFGGRLPDRVLLGCSAGVGSFFYVLTILSGDYRTGLLFMYLAGIAMSGDAISLQSFTAQRFQQGAAKAFALTQAIPEPLRVPILSVSWASERGLWNRRSGSFPSPSPASVCSVAPGI